MNKRRRSPSRQQSIGGSRSRIGQDGGFASGRMTRTETDASVADTPDALSDIGPVSRETIARLAIFVELVRRWQPIQNLVAPSTLNAIWRRHVADSAQVHFAFPNARRWIDLGSGAGFPGLVTAILLAEGPGAMVHLVESNQRKAAFLRAVIRETGCPATVHDTRIGEIIADWSSPIDAVSARALAPLSALCGFAEPFVARGAVAIFHKGKNFRQEIEEASHEWAMNLIEKESLVDPDSRLLILTEIAARPLAGKASSE